MAYKCVTDGIVGVSVRVCMHVRVCVTIYYVCWHASTQVMLACYILWEIRGISDFIHYSFLLANIQCKIPLHIERLIL